MTEEEYLELLDNKPDEALKWMYQSRFVYFTMGEEIAGFDDDLIEEFLEKLMQHLSLTPAQVIKLLEEDDEESEDLRETLETLRIEARPDAENPEQISIWMDWRNADPLETVEWLGQVGYEVEFFGESGSSMGEVGAWFIRSDSMLDA